MKSKKTTFGTKIMFLVLALVAVNSFAKGPKQKWFLIGVCGVWCLYVTVSWLIFHRKSPKKAVTDGIRKAKRKVGKAAKQVKELVGSDSDEAIMQALILHLKCRISDKLKSAYPDATWSWCDKQPLYLIASGGSGRIKTHGTGGYAYAEVKIDQYGRITFDMMNIESLDTAGGAGNTGNSDKPRPEPAVDVNVWYNLMGSQPLMQMITELNTGGHNSLYIRENGEIYVVQDNSELHQGTLENLPGKKYWTELTGILTQDGLSTSVDDNRIVVSW